jgi:hypothetical protein
MTIDDFLARLKSVKHGGDHFVADCPACGDTKQHLSISEGDDRRILVKCFKGCNSTSIVGAMGLELQDLFPPRDNPLGRRIVGAYDYKDAEGKLLYQVVRFDPKDFRQRQPDGHGGWLWNLKGVRSVPYRLPEVMRAKATETIFICEGEKDCDALVKLNLQATCNSGGAGKWTASHSQFLAGSQSVVVIADKDAPSKECPAGKGQWHARSVCASLAGLAESVKYLELPDRNGRKVKDAHDWIAAGGTADELLRLVEAVPEYVPQATTCEGSSTQIREYESVPGATTETTANTTMAKPVVHMADEVPQPYDKFTYFGLRAYQPNPSDSIAGDGWLRRGAGCLLTGGTGLGKSVLVEQLCVCVASGVPFMGITVARPSRVLYVQAENDAETLKRDNLSIVKNVQAKPCPLLVEMNFSIYHAYGRTGKDFAKWLERVVMETRPELVVIDPYQAYIGGMDINNTSTFLQWIGPIDALIKSQGCGLVLVAHTPKPRDRDSWTARESVYMAAGTSAISNWCRTSCELTSCGDDGRYRLRFGKNAERTGLEDDYGNILRDVYIEHSGDRHEPYWRVAEFQTLPSTSKFKDAILVAKAEHPEMSLAKIAESVGCSKTMVQKILSANTPTTAVHRTRTPLRGVYGCTDGEDRSVNGQVYGSERVNDSQIADPSSLVNSDNPFVNEVETDESNSTDAIVAPEQYP